MATGAEIESLKFCAENHEIEVNDKNVKNVTESLESFVTKNHNHLMKSRRQKKYGLSIFVLS